MFDKNRIYTRLEIEKIAEPGRNKKHTQRAYYFINNIGLAFLKMSSEYNNQLLDDNEILWEESSDGKNKSSGINFLTRSNNGLFFFIDDFKIDDLLIWPWQ